jgi:GTP cyclohydrolase III
MNMQQHQDNLNNNININDLTEKCVNISPSIKTKLDIDTIKQIIKEILDKNNEMCKYWINSRDNIFGVSFNVGSEQISAMIKTAFEISIVEGNHDLNTILFTNFN